MAGLGVRKLEGTRLSRLSIRAAKHGVPIEEEGRCLLKEAVSTPECSGDLALAIFGPEHGVDVQLAERTSHEPLELTE